MEFSNQIKSFSNSIDKRKGNVATEEATKTSLIMPFFQILGYDIFDPEEFIPEYTADVGIKKGEKVDYAISIDDQVVMLIEAKAVYEKLDKHSSQLYRYFTATNAKFAILTNGIRYKFFTDLDDQNRMDEKPFLDINLLDLKDRDINELKKFQKSNFDIEHIFSSAEELKYTTEIKNVLSEQLESPGENFVNYILGEIYTGRRTQSTIEKFIPIIKKSFTQFINELVNDRIKNALDKEEAVTLAEEVIIEEVEISKIVTTEEEIEIFYAIKNILKDTVDYEKITFKDTESYFGILFDNNTRKWICRIFINSKNKYILINKSSEKLYFETVKDIYNYKDQLVNLAKEYN